VRLFFLLTVLLVLSGDVQAWGYEGHRLVCALARQYLNDEGRSFADRVGAQGEFLIGGVMTFPESCLWPDKVKYSTRKDSYEHHFINIPVSADSISLHRDCASLTCLPAGIQRSIVYLTTPASGEREMGRQAAALRYLGHYIGDLHQPLHVSHAEDWGGNRIKVSWFGKDTNLHTVWDRGILERAGLSYPDSLEFLSSVRVSPGTIDLVSWLNDSFHLARDRAYRDPGGRAVTSGDTLGRTYLDSNKPVVIEQLALAGARLAAIINAIAAGEPLLLPIN
jgi:nuclease S1